MSAEEATRTAYRPTTPGRRAILWVGAVLVTTAGAQLCLLSANTERYFAWSYMAMLAGILVLGAGGWLRARAASG
jgi:hypothetical protein